MPNPTLWNSNPIASTADIVSYDDAARAYDTSTQSYDGVDPNNSFNNWRSPTAWTSSLKYPASQDYYGPLPSVPLYAGATNWVANPGMVNQSGQYVPSQGANANLYSYDGYGLTTLTTYSNKKVTYSDSTITYSGLINLYPYDESTREYDGTNNNASFANWKKATGWTPITGGNDF